MQITEIYKSLQGESTHAGLPCVFVRLTGCNLRCTWCDTPYTSWRPEGGEWSLDRIMEETRTHGARHVVVTGGEPMIAPQIVELTGRLQLPLQPVVTDHGPIGRLLARAAHASLPRRARTAIVPRPRSAGVQLTAL